MVLIGSYIALFFSLANPTSPVAVGLAMLPPLAPVLMPVRMASGDAAVWQVLVSIALTVATIAALNVLAARIYANSVLRIGARISLREAWRGQR
jgi:ABC-2 type transport system permease protein